MAWSIRDSAELYGVPNWGQRLFSINKAGRLCVEPAGPGRGTVDLYELAQTLGEADIARPLLVRMPQVAARRMKLLVDSFGRAFESRGYTGRYRGVYPVKVNQSRGIVEELMASGAEHGFGLEAGSRAELLVAAAMLENPDALLICNGYKDRAFMESALMARQLGRDTVVVIEKSSEIDLLLDAADRLGVSPAIGVRARLSSPGKGRWSSSAGDRAKFGLNAQAIVALVAKLKARGRLDCLRLLHFHIGSQVSSIRTVTHALREAGHLYCELVRMGAPMGLLDIGGGLAVDYDGSRTDFESSRNYSVREYADNVTAEIIDSCDAAGIPHPDLVTESGRATVAHCSVLLVDVLAAESMATAGPVAQPQDEGHPLLKELYEAAQSLNDRNFQEVWHDANDIRERARREFEAGRLDLETLAAVQDGYWRLCGRLRTVTARQRYVPDDLEGLDGSLADTYYANFSIFQSLPDSWALDQIFPVLPVHRLEEEPTRRVVIADMTCDSDGKLSRFVDLRSVKKMLELHALRPDEPYVLAIPLVGAYQEILGGLHNLFGKVHAVHASVDEDGQTCIDAVIPGATVDAVVRTVDYEPEELLERLAAAAQRRHAAGELGLEEARRAVDGFRAGLASYTYLGSGTLWHGECIADADDSPARIAEIDPCSDLPSSLPSPA